MKRFSEQLNKKAGSVKLRAAEKRALQERVVSYMEYHPLPAEMKAIKSTKTTTSPLRTEVFKEVTIPFASFWKWGVSVAAIVLVVVPFMAERTVPGDTLYSVKVHLNEEVRSKLAFGSYEKVEWQTELLNRRIAEAKLLASEGKLTGEVEADVVAAVREHSESVQKEINALRATDAEEATIATLALNTTLELQSTSLMSGKETNSSTTSSLLAEAIKDSLLHVDTAASALPAFAKLMAHVERGTTRAYELKQSLSVSDDSAEFTDISRRLEDIERSMAEAIGIQSTDGLKAREQLVDILERTQKLVVFMTDIDVSQNVEIEEIVPVVLTRDEENIIILSLEKNVSTTTEKINLMLKNVDEGDIIEKVNFALVSIAENKSRIASSTVFSENRRLLEESTALAADSLFLLEVAGIKTSLPEIELPTISTPTTTEPEKEEVIEESVPSTTESLVEEISEVIIPIEEASSTSVDPVGEV